MTERLTPEREAEIRGYLSQILYYWFAEQALADLLGELDAVRRERDLWQADAERYARNSDRHLERALDAEVQVAVLRRRAAVSDPMNVQDIVRAYLAAYGYDGLADDDCGCWLADLMPCSGDYRHCQPGYQDVAMEEESSYIEPGESIMRPGRRP